jgi:hypothetical protein
MADQLPQQDRRPWPPRERDQRDDHDDVPERPPTEPEPPPMEEPPAPEPPGPYIVEPRIGTEDHPNKDPGEATPRDDAAQPSMQAEEAGEGFATEVASLAPGVSPSEPGTFGKDPSRSR